MGQMNFMRGSQLGMPALGTLGVGDLVRVLDAALVGTGLTAQSCTISVTSAVATATVASHDWVVGQRVTIAGVSGGPTGFAALNGTFRILSVGANTFTFSAAGVSDGAATGSITAVIAHLGWGIAFTGTNQRSYRAASGLRHYLMVNDNSNTNTGIVRGFTAMTAVTTGTGPFPTTAQSDTNLKWPRPDPTSWPTPPASGSYNDSWVVVGDDKRFFLGIGGVGGSTGYKMWFGFGEFQSYQPSDAYNTFIFGHANAVGDDTLNPGQAPYVSSPQQSNQGADAYYGAGCALARHRNQTTASWLAALTMYGQGSTYIDEHPSCGGPAAGTSSPMSGGIEIVGQMEIIENITATATYFRRGRLPLLGTWNAPDFENNDFKVYTGITNFGDVLLIRGYNYTAAHGLIFAVGDWDTVLS